MPSTKSPLCAILGLSLVFAAHQSPVQPDDLFTNGAARGVVQGANSLATDDSCDAPIPLFALLDLAPRNNVLLADLVEDDDDDDGDEAGSAPAVVDPGYVPHHDPPGPSGVIYFDIVIRGKKTQLAVFSRAGPRGDAAAEEEPVNASLLLQRSRTQALGLRFEVESGRRPVGLIAPTATDRHSPKSLQGPAHARRLTLREDRSEGFEERSPGVGEAGRPRDLFTVEAMADAPVPR